MRAQEAASKYVAHLRNAFDRAVSLENRFRVQLLLVHLEPPSFFLHTQRGQSTLFSRVFDLSVAVQVILKPYESVINDER